MYPAGKKRRIRFNNGITIIQLFQRRISQNQAASHQDGKRSTRSALEMDSRLRSQAVHSNCQGVSNLGLSNILPCGKAVLLLSRGESYATLHGSKGRLT